LIDAKYLASLKAFNRFKIHRKRLKSMSLESGEQFDHFAIQDTKDSYIFGFGFN
jgi:hypothetical protein